MAIENGTQNVELAYLLDPAFQIEGLNGKPVIGGWLNVYEAGTDTKVITYQDFEGSRNPFNIKLGSDGRAVILADPSITYDVYAFDSYGNQIFSRLNVTPHLSGNISITGSDVVIYNTDGTLDITQQSIQNNIRRYEINTKHKSFGVQEPLYFVEDSDSATIIGFSGDDYATKDYVNSALSSKLDITAYSSQSGDFLTDKFEYDSDNHITAYNHSAFAAGAGSGTIYEAGDHIDITNSVISVTGLPDSADIENAISSAVTNIENKFEYNENNYITAYNNSAFAGTNYSAGDYVSIVNDTISVTGLQPSGDYATKTDLSGKQDTLSAGDGISIVNNIISVTSQGGGIEQVNHDDTLSGNGNDEQLGIANIEDFVKHNDLTAYQEKGDYYSASNPSGFITNDALTGLQPSGDYVTRDELTAYQPSGNYATIEDVESAVSGKQDILSAGEGIQIINNTISVTAQGGGGITVVNHDNTLSGNGNSEPLGLANAEDYVKQDDLTGYATTALVSSVSSELYSAFSGISGDFELVAGSGVELVDDPTAKTTTINVTAQGGDVSHDNTLSGNGTVDSPLGVVNGYNETVLYSGHIGAGAAPTAYSLSEPISAFDSYRVYWLWNEGTNCAGEVSEFYWDEDRPTMNNFTLFSVNRFSNTNFTALGLFEIASNLKDITYTFSQQNNDTKDKNIKIKKIVGINRKA